MPEGGSPPALNLGETDYELLINATVVLAPAVAGIVPASGSILGGDTVKIVGNYLDGATGVLFGAMPATFTVDSANQITAVAPATPASTVDVRVIGPGGTSATSAGDQYTFTASTALGTAAAPSLISPLAAGVSPTVTGLGQTASRWRRGSQLAKISRAPVGTTFSFSLSKAATVRLQFTQRLGGRKVRGSCRAPSASNIAKPRCKRTVVAGTLSLQGHAGLNKIRFQGRVSNSKSLKLGRYTLSLTARDAGGLQSAPRSLSFEIVN